MQYIKKRLNVPYIQSLFYYRVATKKNQERKERKVDES